MSFWDNVEKILERQNKLHHGWIKELAKNTGIEENTLAMQKRRRTVPRVDDAHLIALTLGTTMEALVTGDIDEPSSINLHSAIAAAQEVKKITDQATHKFQDLWATTQEAEAITDHATKKLRSVIEDLGAMIGLNTTNSATSSEVLDKKVPKCNKNIGK